MQFVNLWPTSSGGTRCCSGNFHRLPPPRCRLVQKSLSVFPLSNPRQQGSRDRPSQTSLHLGHNHLLEFYRPGVRGTAVKHLDHANVVWADRYRLLRNNTNCRVCDWNQSVSIAVIFALFPDGCCLIASQTPHSWCFFFQVVQLGVKMHLCLKALRPLRQKWGFVNLKGVWLIIIIIIIIKDMKFSDEKHLD